MNSHILIYLGLFLVLGIDLLTVAASSALRNANLARVLHLREELGSRGDKVLQLMHTLPRPYAGLHIFQSIWRVAFIGVVYIALPWGESVNAFLAWGGILLGVALLISWLEWVVERRVKRAAEIWAIRLRWYIQAVSVALYPLVRVSLWLSRDTTVEGEVSGTVTEDELKILLEAGQQDGTLEQEESQMIFSIFQLGDTLTREIMVPRIDMLAIDIHTPLPEAVDALLQSGYSRAPVYEGRVDNVLGVLYAKDLLRVWREGNGEENSIRSILREPYFVPEAKKVDELLAEMQHRHVHMAIVVDEYGGVAGVVTLEDIMEEIFGEIQDEYDEEEQPYHVEENGDYIFRGRIDIDDFNEIMDSELPREEADTLSGFIYGRLGHVPVTGESLQVGNLELVVDQVSNRRIRKVRARKITGDGESDVEQ